MNSCIYHGGVMHHRLEPASHRFEYTLCFFGFDLSELYTLDQSVHLFGYNRFRPFSLHDRDHLDPTPEPIDMKIRRWLTRHGYGKEIARICLVTAARYFNYVFNPVSFYLCYNRYNDLCCSVIEVNNTFGDKHIYVLNNVEPSKGVWRTNAPHVKEFHVSPFNDMKGEYEFSFDIANDELDIKINMNKEGKPVFLSSVCGVGRTFSTGAIVKALMRYPFSTALTMPRIIHQASKLYFGKKLKVYDRLEPEHPLTMRARPIGKMNQWAMQTAFKALEHLRHGKLCVRLPHGEVKEFGDQQDTTPCEIKVKRYGFFKKCLFKGDIGFGEGYVDEDWDCDDLTRVIELFIQNQKHFNLAFDPSILSRFGRLLHRWGHLRKRNTRSSSQKNIHDHYDLGNSFFETFLDPSMTYSSAYYKDPQETLEQAQLNKLKKIIHKANLGCKDHVLEIGSGWGSFAIEAVRQSGCQVTTITLSKEQQERATARVKEAGLSDRIKVQRCDYRDIRGSFDKIVSIEMLEAVGHEYLGTFFQCCDQLLKPHGTMVVQVITIPDDSYEVYRKDCDWIQKYIFPGGMLPSVEALNKAMKKHTAFFVEDLENIGPHYARTLNAWRTNFLSHIDKIKEQGYDKHFQRLWIYYLCYCEAAFSTRKLNTHQLVSSRRKSL
ncbi:MAG: DUF1365 family protein [Kiritimatiellae bacterium]|nr:DUF1365 family protein [Kiritimatiellia bacterium]